MKYSDLGHAFNRNMKIMSIHKYKWSDSLVVRWHLQIKPTGIKTWKSLFYTIVQLHPFLKIKIVLIYFTISRGGTGGLHIFQLYLVAFIFIIS